MVSNFKSTFAVQSNAASNAVNGAANKIASGINGLTLAL